MKELNSAGYLGVSARQGGHAQRGTPCSVLDALEAATALAAGEEEDTPRALLEGGGRQRAEGRRRAGGGTARGGGRSSPLFCVELDQPSAAYAGVEEGGVLSADAVGRASRSRRRCVRALPSRSTATTRRSEGEGNVEGNGELVEDKLKLDVEACRSTTRRAGASQRRNGALRAMLGAASPANRLGLFYRRSGGGGVRAAPPDRRPKEAGGGGRARRRRDSSHGRPQTLQVVDERHRLPGRAASPSGSSRR